MLSDTENLDMSIMDMEVRMKWVEDNQNYFIHQLNYLQQSMGCIMPSSFFQLPFPPPPFTPFSTNSPPCYVQSPPVTQFPSSVLSPQTFPGSLRLTQPATPTRSAPTTSKDSPLPLSKTCINALPSSAIHKDTLISVEDVFKKYFKLKHESKVETLACKLAKEAIFGPDVMKQCTPIGN